MNIAEIFEILEKPGRDRRPFTNQILQGATLSEISVAFQVSLSPERRYIIHGSLSSYLLCYVLSRKIKEELYVESQEIKKVIPLLIVALDDSCEGVREEAADVLGYIGDPIAGPALFKLYQQNDDDSDLRYITATAMAACQYTEAIPVLIEALSSSNPGLRRQASLGLYRLKAQVAIEPLRKALSNETDSFPKLMMESSLQKLEQECVFGYEKKEIKIKRLIALLKDAETDEKLSQVAKELTYLTSKNLIVALIPLLKHERLKVRQTVAWIFAEIACYANTFLLISQNREQVQRSLIEALNDADSKMRIKVANALGMWGEKEAIAPLLLLINDGDLSVRKSVVAALGFLHQFSDGQTLEPLLNTFFTDENFDIRYIAAEGLGFLKDNRAVDAMIKALQNKKNKVRIEAARILSALKNESAIDALIQALEDNNQKVREWSVEALWQLCSNELSKQAEEKMKKGLQLALLDENIEVRDSVQKILNWLDIPN